MYMCRDHRNAYMREYWKRPENTERRRQHNHGRNKQSFLTLEEFDAMKVLQDDVCAICKRPETFRTSSGDVREMAIDHCHQTGAVRGLLCSACNRGIGMLGDDWERVQSAADYLRSHRS